MYSSLYYTGHLITNARVFTNLAKNYKCKVNVFYKSGHVITSVKFFVGSTIGLTAELKRKNKKHFLFFSFYRCQKLKKLFFFTFFSLPVLTSGFKPSAKGLRVDCSTTVLSYYDISLLYSWIHLKWISLCYCAKSWRQNYP